MKPLWLLLTAVPRPPASMHLVYDPVWGLSVPDVSPTDAYRPDPGPYPPVADARHSGRLRHQYDVQPRPDWRGHSLRAKR